MSKSKDELNQQSRNDKKLEDVVERVVITVNGFDEVSLYTDIKNLDSLVEILRIAYESQLKRRDKFYSLSSDRKLRQ